MGTGALQSRAIAWAAVAVVLGGVVAGCAPARRESRGAAPAAVSEEATDTVRAGLGRLPVSFVANQGRWDSRASWVVAGAEATAYFLDGSVRWALAGDNGTFALDQVLLGARSAPPTASVPGAGVVSYFGAETHAGMPTANELVLTQAWPGVDVTWSGTGGNIEATYRLAPYADPNQVRIAWRGAESLAVTGDGRLAVTTPLRTFEEDAPKAFQDIAGKRVPVEVAYELQGSDVYGFRLGAYDTTRPLVIDPTVLVYAGFLGGAGNETGRGIAVDSAGNAYLTGDAGSREDTFPETPGVFQPAYGDGLSDAFVAKVDATGSTLLYASFLGGTGTDTGFAIAVDAAGNAYVIGQTNSSAPSFPVTGGVFQAQNAGGADAFVSKVNPSGTALLYAGFLGGDGSELGNSIAVDAAGNAYVTGQTSSLAASFPETPGAFGAENAGGTDVFVAKVNPSGSTLLYAGFLGGSGPEFGGGIAVGPTGNAYVTGTTRSLAATFPETPGAFQTELSNPEAAFAQDAFVAKVDATGSTLSYATFLGGSSSESGTAVAVDTAGNAYVTGQTASSAPSFPATAGVFQPQNAGNGDAFVVKVNPSGSGLVYASFLGGTNTNVLTGNETGRGIALDGTGNAYITGSTSSPAASFPETPGMFQPENAGGNSDAFVAKVNPTGTTLVYAGFLGGSAQDSGNSIAVDGSGNAYVTGEVQSSADTFPETAGVFQTERAGLRDAFVVKIAEPASLSINDVTVAEGNAGTTTFTFTITRAGDTSGASSVDWSTLDGSAVAPSDYTAVPATTVNFAAGETTKTVSVTVKGDTSIEPNDGFTVNLSNPAGATITDGTGVGRIANDDSAAFAVDNVTVTEGNAGTKLATFTVTRTGATADAATVQYRTLDVHATAGSDYTAVPLTTLSFAANQTSRTLSVTVMGDTVVEPTEVFYVRLTSPTGGHTIADATGVGTITNDDTAAVNSFAVSDAAAVLEGDSGTKTATFTVSRTGNTTQAASVQWFTVAGTAGAGSDFVNVSPTTLNFAANETSKPVSVTVNGDTAVEANETFLVRLGSPVGATVADGSGLGRITDDDAATVSLNDVALTEGNAGTKLFTFTVTRTGDAGGTATVQWSTANGSATAGSDYVAVAATTLSFGPGETTKQVSVTVNGDTAIEGNETFTVKLASPVGASLGDSSGLGRINNDD